MDIAFWILATGTVLSALAVILPPFGRNPVHGALSLVLCFFFLAGLYVLLVAHLVAALQVLVYAGAIVVLFMFVIMLLNIRPEDLGTPRPTATKLVGVGAAVFFLMAVIGAASRAGTTGWASLPASTSFGSVKTVGYKLYTDFLVPFELTSILLLVAVIGALVMAKRRL